MRRLFRHPVLSGIGFETLLVALSLCFPVGVCNQPVVGVLVAILHLPAACFVECVLGFPPPEMEWFACVILMVPVWIVLLLLARWLADLDARDQQTEEHHT